MNTVPHRHRFDVEEYYRVTDGFPPEVRTELMDGDIFEMVPPGNRHAACVSRLNRLFTVRLAERAIVRVQDPLRLSDFFEPQPDVAVLRDRADFYDGGHPGAGDTLLVIEVCASSYAYDRNAKIPAYARHGVPEVWLVVLDRELVEVFREPAGGEYRFTRTFRVGDTVEAADVRVAVGTLFGR